MDNKRFVNSSFELDKSSIAVLVAYGIQVVFQVILYLFKLPTVAYTWTVIVVNQLILFGVFVFFCFREKVDPLAVTGAKNPPKWYFFPLFALIAIACIMCFAPLSGLFSKLLVQLGYEHEPNYYLPLKSGGLFTLAFLGLTILPALGEESMMRGVLLSGAKKKSPLFAIFYTALVFALFHGNLTQLIHQFLLGAVMGYLVYITGSIYASMTVHIVNNGVAMLLDYGRANGWINKTLYWYVGGKLGAEPTIIGMSVSLFALMMFLVLVTCLLHKDRLEEKEYDPEEKGFFNKINAYLIYLSTPDKESEKAECEAVRSKSRVTTHALVLAWIVAAVFAAVVLLTLLPGGNS